MPVDTSAIIPAHNEEHGLPVVLEELLKVIPVELYEIIVVEDGSTDRTADVARRYPCRLLSHECNRGKAEAIRTGIAAARGEKVVFIDADGSYPPSSRR